MKIKNPFIKEVEEKYFFFSWQEEEIFIENKDPPLKEVEEEKKFLAGRNFFFEEYKEAPLIDVEEEYSFIFFDRMKKISLK